MKKILLFSLLILSIKLFADDAEYKKWFTAFSAGYAFKHDSSFKDVYGRGMVNIITGDCCYYPWEKWGFGAKFSYWRKKGHTSFLRQCATVREVPITFYVRRRMMFECGLQMYASLGGGIVWIKDKSYLGTAKLHKGVGELEVGLNYPVWRCINIVGAVRYLFPPQTQVCDKVDVGGVDVRAGIGFTF